MPITQYRMIALAKAALAAVDLTQLIRRELDELERRLATEPLEPIAVVQYLKATILANQLDPDTIGTIYVENERFSGQRLQENEKARQKQKLYRQRRAGRTAPPQGQANPQESDLLPNPWANGQAQPPQESTPKVTRRSLSPPPSQAAPAKTKPANPPEPIHNLSDYIDGYRPGHTPQAIPQESDLEDL